jgi:hypothetical protein
MAAALAAPVAEASVCLMTLTVSRLAGVDWLLTLHSDRTDRPAAVRFKFSQLPFAARRGGPHEDVLTRSPCCCLRAAP